LPLTRVWHDVVPPVMLVDDRQHTCPPAQSAASLHVTVIPAHSLPFGWHAFGSPITSQHALVARGHEGPASPTQLTKPGVHGGPPGGGSQAPMVPDWVVDAELDSEVVEELWTSEVVEELCVSEVVEELCVSEVVEELWMSEVDEELSVPSVTPLDE